MSFPAQVFRVLIASPSDVTTERDIAVRTIQEWNDLNAAERQLVLLPLRWETHSAPEYGKRPQEVINRQVVDHCDLLIGAFWTRVGSPTGVADSGTIEEIERVAMDGKPVMLYFSQTKQDPDKLDLDQLSKLREFKKKTFPKALIEAYSDPVEFKDKLSKQLEIQLRSLLAEKTENELGRGEVSPVTDIVFHFADPESKKDAGPEITIATQAIEIANFESIPDYSAGVAINPGVITLQSLQPNRDYYRQVATNLVLREFFRPVRFWLKNQGGVGARDIYLDINIRSENGDVTFISRSKLPSSQPTKETGFFAGERHPTKPDELTGKPGKAWRTQIELKALQPQRELSPDSEYLIGASQSCEVVVSARIYADTLSEPSVQELKLHLEVEKGSIDANELLKDAMRVDTKIENEIPRSFAAPE